jgi:WD40 repeat protein
MGTPRAVKIVWRRQFESERPYEREFAGIQGYEPVSRTSEGLMQVLHVGRNDAEGYFYYVMELADDAKRVVSRSVFSEPVGSPPLAGVDLLDTDLLDTGYSPHTLRSDLNRFGQLPIADCLRIALDLVTGLSCLHRHGLVHRDVKPGNIIFVNGRAKLADIGLVSTRNEGRTFVGTEGYIPPEGPGSPAADLYALGMVLYEVATGQPPEKFPQTPLEWFADGASGEKLEFHEIVLKAGEGSRQRRYQTAGELQADLALLQTGQSLRRVRALQRRANLSRRLALAAVIAGIVAVGSVLIGNYRVRVEAEQRERAQRWREDAERARAGAEQAERRASERLFASLLEQARAVVRNGEMGQRVRALDALRQAAAISNTVELRREVFAALALPDLRLVRELPFDATFTFRELDSSFGRIALGHGTQSVEVRSVDGHGQPVMLPASTNLPAHNAWWSGDGRWLAVKRDYAPDGLRADLEVWDVPSARRVVLRRDVPAGAMSFHPRLHQCLAVGTKGGAVVVDSDAQREVASVPLAGKPLQLRFSPDGGRLAALYPMGSALIVSVHDVTNGQSLAAHAFAGGVNVMAWHPNGQWLAVAELSGFVQRMDARSAEMAPIGRHKAQAAAVMFSPDGDYLLSGGWDGDLICWDARTMQRAFTIGLESYQAQWSAEGHRCAVVTDAGIQMHEFVRPSGYREFGEDLGARLRRASFSPDGRWLAAAADKRMGIWDLSNHSPAFQDDAGFEAHLFFTPDARELFGCQSGRHKAFRWSLSTTTNANAPARWERRVLHRPDGFTFLNLLSNSVVITAAKGSQILAPGDIETGRDNWTATEPGTSAISPDGRWLAIFRSFGRELHVYKLPGFETVARLVHPGGIGQAGFTPDSGEVTISSRVGVEFWSTKNWQRTRVLTNFVRVHFSPNPNEWWLVKDQRAGGLYDARTLKPLLLLPRGMLPLAASPDGRHLAVSIDARRLQVWDLAALRGQMGSLGLDWEP